MPEVSKENLSDFLESLYFGAIPTDEEVFQEFKKLCEMFLLFSTYEKPAFMEETAIVKDISRVEDKVMPILSEVSKYICILLIFDTENFKKYYLFGEKAKCVGHIQFRSMLP